MNKKILAAAVAAAVVAAPAAFAESVVYGKFHTSVDMVDNEKFNGTPTPTETDNYSVNSRASRLGFKGSEDLGGGLKAIYQAEFTVTTDGGAAQAVGNGWGGQRNTFIGLAGDWGTFVVGRHDTPAKMAFYAAGNEKLGDSIIDLNPGGGSVTGVFTEVRANNAIAYVSPSFSGFTVAGAIVPGEETDGAGDRADSLADHYSIGVMWSGMGFKASLGYEEFENQGNATIANGIRLSQLGLGAVAPGAPDTDIEILQVGGSYTFGAFSVGAHYQDTTIDDGGVVIGGSGDLDYEAFGLSGKATFGNNAISLVYTMAEADAGTVGDVIDFDAWGVAAEHNFSKRTKVYAAYASSEDDELDLEDDRFSLGMVHSF